MPGRLTLGAARRIGLAAQGFGRPHPAQVSLRHVQAEINRLAQFQIDSVNVAVRAQYMPLFSRLGAYDTALLDRASGRSPRRLFEYWGHAACLLDAGLEPALRLRVRDWRARDNPSVAALLQDNPDLLTTVVDAVRERGPLTARDLDSGQERRRDHWGWNWSQTKHLLEHLFNTGVVSVAARNAQFERLYDLRDRVLPPAIVQAPDLPDAEASDVLVRRAASALGVFDLTAVSQYFYLSRARAAASLARLEASGEVEPVEVQGLTGKHWLWAAARRPRTLHAQALVSPFDSLVFERNRLERLFDTRYRIEIYVPAAQRVYGYYVYLLFLGDVPVARVDLKADRGAGVLRVQAAWRVRHDEGTGPDEPTVARALRHELASMAGWLGLGRIDVAGRGDLAHAL